MIQVKGLTYHYPGPSAFSLRGISFTLGKGEWVALMGGNGSGKTTLVRCLNGLIIPEDGDVLVDGLSLRETDHLQEIRRRLGMVFQNPTNQIVAATVERDIAFGLENLGLPADVMRQRVSEAVERFHLSGYEMYPPHLLSGGERQRLALASVWVMRPGYLVLDEPTSLLDPAGREDVINWIKKEKDESNPGILLITQYPEEAMMCDRMLVLHQGELIMDGPPRTLFMDTERFHSLGLGVPVEIELGKLINDDLC